MDSNGAYQNEHAATLNARISNGVPDAHGLTNTYGHGSNRLL